MTQALSREEVLDELREVRARYLSALASTPPDRAYARPSDEAWSIGEIAAHMAEYSDHIRTRLLLMRDEPDPLIGRVPGAPERTAAVEQHGHDPLDQLGEAVATTWEEVERIVRGMSEAQWERVCRHMHYGTVTAGSYLGRQPSHFVEHTEEISRLQAADALTPRT